MNVCNDHQASKKFGVRLQQMTLLLVDKDHGLLSAADKAKSRVLDMYMQRFQVGDEKKG